MMGWSLEMLMSDEQEASFLIVYKTTSSPRDSPTHHTPTYLHTYLYCFPKTIKKYAVGRRKRKRGGRRLVISLLSSF